MQSDFEKAETIGAKRQRILPMMAVLLLAQQATYWDWDGRGVSTVKLAAWTVLALVVLAYLYTGGSWLASAEVRALANDEVTRANRTEALGSGFLAAVLTAIVVFVIAPFEPVGAQRAAHMIVTIGLAIALLRFALLERKALA